MGRGTHSGLRQLLPMEPSLTHISAIQGLRGIAAIFVVTSHLVRGYADWLLRPAVEPHGYIPWYDWPFIRVYAEGFPWVAVFLVLTGYVNALAPIQKARAGNTAGSLSGLASSAFRRTLRLVLPCTVATILSWTIAQCGGYNIARMVDCDWMNNSGSPERSASFVAAIQDLVRAIYHTWAYADNDYDRDQWSMTWFLKATMTLYITLLATVRAQPRNRMLIFLALCIYSWYTRDTLVGIPVFAGGLLCELSMEPIVSKFSASRGSIRRALPISMAIVGWYLMSYSGFDTEWASWSNSLLQIGIKIFPEGSEILSFWDVTGVILLVAAIILSSPLQHILSRPWLLWLGTQSFPIYLLHGPLLRSFLNWMLFAFAEPQWYEERDENDVVVRIFPRLSMPPRWKFLFAIPIFFAVVLLLSRLWTAHVEPWCAQVTKWAEETVCGTGRKTQKTEEPKPILDELVNANEQVNGEPKGPILPV